MGRMGYPKVTNRDNLKRVLSYIINRVSGDEVDDLTGDERKELQIHLTMARKVLGEWP